MVVDERQYEIFSVLSDARKIQFCLDYLEVGIEFAQEHLMDEIVTPDKDPKCLLACTRTNGDCVDLVYSGEFLYLQSNEYSGIERCIERLFNSGEILYHFPDYEIKKIFKFAKTMKIITGERKYPLCHQ